MTISEAVGLMVIDALPATNPSVSVVAVGAMLPSVVAPVPPSLPLPVWLPQLTLVPTVAARSIVSRARPQRRCNWKRTSDKEKMASAAAKLATSQFGEDGVPTGRATAL